MKFICMPHPPFPKGCVRKKAVEVSCNDIEDVHAFSASMGNFYFLDSSLINSFGWGCYSSFLTTIIENRTLRKTFRKLGSVSQQIQQFLVKCIWGSIYFLFFIPSEEVLRQRMGVLRGIQSFHDKIAMLCVFMRKHFVLQKSVFCLTV